MKSFSTEIAPFFHKKNYFVQFLFLLLLIIGGTIILTAFGQLIATLLSGEEVSDIYSSVNNIRIIQTFSSIGTFLIPALLFSYFAQKNIFSYSEADKSPTFSPVLIVLILSIFLQPIVYSLAYWNEMIELPTFLHNAEVWMKQMEDSSNSILTLLADNSKISILLLNILLLALVPAVCEEFLFRGTLQPFINKLVKNHHIAIWITAFIFSAIHLQFYGFIPRMLLGAYLGYLWVWSGSLWLPIIAHFLHNSSSLIFNYIDFKNNLNFDNLTPADIPGYIPIMITSTILISVGLFIIWKRRNKKNAVSQTETA